MASQEWNLKESPPNILAQAVIDIMASQYKQVKSVNTE